MHITLRDAVLVAWAAEAFSLQSPPRISFLAESFDKTGPYIYRISILVAIPSNPSPFATKMPVGIVCQTREARPKHLMEEEAGVRCGEKVVQALQQPVPANITAPRSCLPFIEGKN